MKNILFGMMLILTFSTSFSQEVTIKKYTTIVAINKGVIDEKKVDLTIVYKSDTVVFHYMNGEKKEWRIVSNLVEGINKNGWKFVEFKMISADKGNEAFLQVFYENKAARLVFSSDYIIEFYE